MVRGGVLQGLEPPRDPQGGGVVVRAVVQCGDPPLRGAQHGRDGAGPVRAQDHVRGLHLDLEAQPPGRQTERVLQRQARLHHHGHLLHRGDLGQREHESLGQPVRADPCLPEPALAHQGAQEQVQGAQPAVTGGGLEALEADARERRGRTRGAVPGERGHRAGGAHGVGVLLGVRALAVAVLEVQSQVLDGLGAKLLADAGHEIGCDRGVDPGELSQGRETTRFPGRRRRRGTPLGGRPLRDEVRQDVARVHGLAGP